MLPGDDRRFLGLRILYDSSRIILNLSRRPFSLSLYHYSQGSWQSIRGCLKQRGASQVDSVLTFSTNIPSAKCR